MFKKFMGRHNRRVPLNGSDPISSPFLGGCRSQAAKPDEEAVIGELAGLVNAFRDRALSMGTPRPADQRRTT